MAGDAAIVHAAAWVAAAAAAYLLAGAGIAAFRAFPRAGRRALGVTVAVAFLAAGVGVAQADGQRHRPAVSATWPLAVRSTQPAHVVVRSGDSLWAIAARRLTDPLDAHVALTWPRWWRANRGVIGRDPDLIHPGQRLRPPHHTRSKP